MDLAKRINCAPRYVYFLSKMRKNSNTWKVLRVYPSGHLFLASESRGNIGYGHDDASDYL